MHEIDGGSTPDALTPGYVPETIVNRADEFSALTDAFANHGMQHLYIHGDRGTGKTLVSRASITECPDHMTTCYVPCTRFDTQYQVLKQVYRTLTGDDINNGHHTAQLQRRIEKLLTDRTLVLVLDEIDFLLANDGNDLLYYLTRLDHPEHVNSVAISSNHADPAAVIENRARSSLQPGHITFDPYKPMQAHDILEERLREADLLDAVDRDVLTFLVSRTRNIQLGLQWLVQATATAEDRITVELLRTVKGAAEQRYRETLLDEFSIHHQLLLNAISDLETGNDITVKTGPVYERYVDLCNSAGQDSVTHRRVSDFLIHLELLGIIDVEHLTGGKEGRTRSIRLKNHLA